MKFNNVLIKDSTTFLHTFFFGNDSYSADIIDNKVDAFIITMCLKEYITVEFEKGKRVYRITNEGKKVIGR